MMRKYFVTTLMLLSGFCLDAIHAQVLVFKGSKIESGFSIPGEGSQPLLRKNVVQTYLIFQLDSNRRISKAAEIEFNTKTKRYRVGQQLQISPYGMTGVVVGKDKAILAYPDWGDTLVAEGRVNKGSIVSLIFDSRTDLDTMLVKGIPLTAGGVVMTDGIRMGVFDYLSSGAGLKGTASKESFSWDRTPYYLSVNDRQKNFQWSFQDDSAGSADDQNLSQIVQKRSYVTRYINTAQYNIAIFPGSTFAQKVSAVEALLKRQKMVKVDEIW